MKTSRAVFTTALPVAPVGTGFGVSVGDPSRSVPVPKIAGGSLEPITVCPFPITVTRTGVESRKTEKRVLYRPGRWLSAELSTWTLEAFAVGSSLWPKAEHGIYDAGGALVRAAVLAADVEVYASPNEVTTDSPLGLEWRRVAGWQNAVANGSLQLPTGAFDDLVIRAGTSIGAAGSIVVRPYASSEVAGVTPCGPDVVTTIPAGSDASYALTRELFVATVGLGAGVFVSFTLNNGYIDVFGRPGAPG